MKSSFSAFSRERHFLFSSVTWDAAVLSLSVLVHGSDKYLVPESLNILRQTFFDSCSFQNSDDSDNDMDNSAEQCRQTDIFCIFLRHFKMPPHCRHVCCIYKACVPHFTLVAIWSHLQKRHCSVKFILVFSLTWPNTKSAVFIYFAIFGWIILVAEHSVNPYL